MSTLEALLADVLVLVFVTLFELLSKLFFDVVGDALQRLLDFDVVALLRAATEVGVVLAPVIMVAGAPRVGSGVEGGSGDGAIE